METVVVVVVLAVVVVVLVVVGTTEFNITCVLDISKRHLKPCLTLDHMILTSHESNNQDRYESS